MPGCEDHLEQAIHNQKLAEKLLRTLTSQKPKTIEYKDWAITIAFYSAVHLVEAYLDKTKGLHTDEEASKEEMTAHSYRVHFVGKEFNKQIYTAFKTLFNYSLTMRYLQKSDRVVTRGRWLADIDVTNLVTIELRYLRNEIERKISLHDAIRKKVVH